MLNTLVNLKDLVNILEIRNDVIIFDKIGTITYVTKRFFTYYGYKEEEIIGNNIKSPSFTNLNSKEFKKIQSTILKKGYFKGIIEEKTKKSLIIVSEIVILPIKVDNQISQFICYRSDYSKSIEAQMNIIESIVNAENNPVVILDDNFLPIFTNIRFIQIFGHISENEDFTKHFIQENGYLKLESSNSLQEKLARLLLKIKILKKSQRKVKILNKDNNSHNIFIIDGIFIKNEIIKGKFYNLLTFTDITELEQLKLEQLNNNTLAYIGQLSASITHEINTPLTYIKGNIELMKDDVEDLENIDIKNNFLDSISIIEDGISRISTIIDSMRETASISKNNIINHNVYSTIIYACRMIYSKAKHISQIYINGELFDPKMDINQIKIFADIIPQRIEQVWIILLNNSIEQLNASKIPYKDRSINIDISAKNDRIRIIHSDNGGGIPEEILEDIFQPFFTNKNFGMGVGLGIAKAIIDSHHGSINAINQKQKAVFEIII